MKEETRQCYLHSWESTKLKKSLLYQARLNHRQKQHWKTEQNKWNYWLTSVMEIHHSSLSGIVKLIRNLLCTMFTMNNWIQLIYNKWDSSWVWMNSNDKYSYHGHHKLYTSVNCIDCVGFTNNLILEHRIRHPSTH